MQEYWVGQRRYTVRFTSMRLFCRRDDGACREVAFSIDHDAGKILIRSGTRGENRRQLILFVVDCARREAEADHLPRPIEPGSRVTIVPATGRYWAWVSGCFRVPLVPWPWW